MRLPKPWRISFALPEDGAPLRTGAGEDRFSGRVTLVPRYRDEQWEASCQL